MRYVPRNCIKDSAILAMPVLGANGEILLREGITMNRTYIDRLIALGIPGAYVDDPLSSDLEIKAAISQEVKSATIQQISSAFAGAMDGSDRKKADASGAALFKSAEKIVEQIINHGDVMLNLFDIKTYDSYTYFHCMNVAVLSIVIGVALDYTEQNLVQLAYAALLHDIGKVFIDDNIINKKGKLTPDEMAKVACHPRDGYEYVRKNFYSTISIVTARGVLDHHERVNGTGYPNNLKENEISEFGRIISVADVYDALVSDRPYRKGVFPAEAIEYIQGNCTTLFDLKIVQAFTRKVAPFQVGTSVKLSDGSIALVVENYEGFAQRPRVKVFMKNNEEIEPYYLCLKDEAFNITVVSMVEV